MIENVTKLSDIESLSGPDLMTLYNELAESQGMDSIKRFSDRAAGIRRCQSLFTSASASTGSQPVASKTPTSTKTKTKIKTKTKTEPKADANEPMHLPEGDNINHHRPGTVRGKLIAAMYRDKGATMGEMQKIANGESASEVKTRLRLINSYVGHGIEEDSDGVFWLAGNPKARKPFDFPRMQEVRELRTDTKRELTFNMLSAQGGATFEAVRDANGWNDVQAYEGIKLLHSYVGYGLSEDEEGNIQIV